MTRQLLRPTGVMAGPIGVMAAGVLASAVLLVGALPASAAYDPRPRVSWVPNGAVHAVREIAGRVYLGGDFTSLRNPATGEVVSRSRLAALDGTTGDLVRNFAPRSNGTVYALAGTADGSRIFAAGTFGTVNGSSRGRLAGLDPYGNLLRGWNAYANSTVRTLAVHGDRLYAGGSFSTMSRTGRSRLAAVSIRDAAVSSWNPGADGYVFSIAPSAAGTDIVVGGQFRRLGGRSRDYLGSVSVSTGTVTGWRPPAQCFNTSNPCYVWDVAVADKVYVAVAGPGGRLVAYNSSTGSQAWRVYADGDVQAVAYADGLVYAGGHFDPDFGGQVRHQIAAVNSSTGQVDSRFAPYLYSAYPGVWDLAAGSSYLRVGGAFTGMSGSPQARYVEFPVR